MILLSFITRSSPFFQVVSEYYFQFNLWKAVDSSDFLEKIRINQDHIVQAYVGLLEGDQARDALEMLGRSHDVYLARYGEAPRWDMLLCQIQAPSSTC